MRALIACEFSGIVREAFKRKGHYAMSCDLIPSEIDGLHYQGDIFDVLDNDWDILIAHPPCTHTSVSGARWFKEKVKEQEQALEFVLRLMQSKILKICIEHPVSMVNSLICKPTQIIQPWQFGHGETKKTCLWLKYLPPLRPTRIVNGREGRVWKEPPSEDRWKNRSRTYQGIARAMASQWG